MTGASFYSPYSHALGLLEGFEAVHNAQKTQYESDHPQYAPLPVAPMRSMGFDAGIIFDVDLPEVGANQFEPEFMGYQSVGVNKDGDAWRLNHEFIYINGKLYKNGSPHIAEGDTNGEWATDDNDVDFDPNEYKILIGGEVHPFMIQMRALPRGFLTHEALGTLPRHQVSSAACAVILRELSLVPVEKLNAQF